jgi:hypothetical protein
MKRELKWIAVAVGWLVMLGFVGPALISCDDTLGVLLGVVLILSYAYFTYRFIRKEINHEPA